MKRIILRIWPTLTILLVVLIFFYPVWLKGSIPLPADFIVGVYYPWLDYKWSGYGAGVPVKNPITTDVVSFIFPMQMFAIEQLKIGVIPLWNNLILTGTPLMANFQSAPFSPTNFLYFILPNLTAWSLQIILQPLLAAIFLYILLRFFQRSQIASIAGGIFYAFAGFITIWMQWNGHGLTAAFFPLIILLVLKWIQQPSILKGVVISIALALQIFSGYPQIILYQFIALVILIFIFDFKLLFDFKKILKFIFFILLGIGLAALQTLPAYELLTLSQRKVELVLNEWAFLPWQLIITLVAPDFFGSHATRNYWGPADYTLTTGFSGVVVIILASLGLLKNFKLKEVKFAIGLVLVSLLIAFSNPLTVAIKESGFLGLQAASAHRILILSNLGFAILASFGVDTLLLNRANIKDWIRSLYIPLILLIGYLIASIYIFLLSRGQSAQLSTNINVGIRNLGWPLIVLLISIILNFLAIKLKKFTKLATILIIILAVLDLFRFGWKFTPFSPAEFVFPETPILDFLHRQSGNFRISAEDVIPINFMMSYKLQTAEGYDAVYPLRSAKYISSLNSELPNNTPMGRYGSVSNYNSRLLDIANVKYVLALKRDMDGKPDKTGQITAKFDSHKYKKIFEDSSVAILENTTVLPRSFMVYDWEVSKDDNLTISRLIKDFPVNKKIILEQNPGNINKNEGSLKVVNYKQKSNQKIIDVETDRDGLLFVADAYYPGWKAYVDGLIVPLMRADYNFMAVPIKAGKHQVHINYEPDSFKTGTIISAISLVCLFVLSAWCSINRKKNYARS